MTHHDLTTARVRRATPDDAAPVAALAALTFPLACPPGASPEAMAAHVAAQLSPDRFRTWATSVEHVLLLVETGAGETVRVLGYSLLARGVPDDADVARVVGTDEVVELSKIYVHPDAQGTGVAGALMVASLDAARSLGPGLTLWLGTNGENERAQAFYRKHGFATAGGRTYVVGGEEHSDVVMVHRT
ncbi:N-acetyltransferase [Cellulosimicrobium arenosum]|uniref:GNAT family N-acetyltransferase n=1 Tax=Cellulosimicrobium arenosum TaxID=2708133 RepID=UPI0030CA2011